MDLKSVSLKILEAYTRDVGRGFSRIDYDTLKSPPKKRGSSFREALPLALHSAFLIIHFHKLVEH
jgi:hypothetical protein